FARSGRQRNAEEAPRRAARRYRPFTGRRQTSTMSDEHAEPAETPINTAAMTAFGREHDGAPGATRKQVVSWAMWDWALQPFNTVILTFVWIALYLTSRM